MSSTMTALEDMAAVAVGASSIWSSGIAPSARSASTTGTLAMHMTISWLFDPQKQRLSPAGRGVGRNHGSMGIRYYAYPLAPEFVARAMDDPRPYLSDDPLADAWGLGRPKRPDMLYLDKCWRELQRLTTAHDGTIRRAHALFAGDVTHTPRGWIPWIDVLTPDDVDDVARDLALLDTSDVEALFTEGGDGSDEKEYVGRYLREAREFTARLQQRGWGLIYLIG